MQSLHPLNERKGTLHIERDLSLGYHRFRFGPVKLWWKSVPGYEIVFITEEEDEGVHMLLSDKGAFVLRLTGSISYAHD